MFMAILATVMLTVTVAQAEQGSHTRMYAPSSQSAMEVTVERDTAAYDSYDNSVVSYLYALPYESFTPGCIVGGAFEYLGDDYTTVGNPNWVDLDQWKFVGGLGNCDGIDGGDVLWVMHFDDCFTYITSWGVLLPQDGNFIWTITIGGGTPIPGSGYAINEAYDYNGDALAPAWWFSSDQVVNGANDGASLVADWVVQDILGDPLNIMAFGISGVDIPDPRPVGACCAAIPGACYVSTECDCILASGTYLGDGTACEGDVDGDGIDGECGDLCPLDPDTDGDGFDDCVDNCPGVPNPGQEDGDGDTVGDVCDNCPAVSNPGQADADSDGYGDACDNCPDDPDKVEPGICGCGVADAGDSDDDGVLDCVDVCPGADDAIIGPCPGAIPTVSEWGLVALALLLLAVGKVYFGRRPELG